LWCVAVLVPVGVRVVVAVGVGVLVRVAVAVGVDVALAVVGTAEEVASAVRASRGITSSCPMLSMSSGSMPLA